jgi:multidrug resistance efflux pump
MMFALLPLAMAGGAYWYVTGGRFMSTDDAYVDADKVGISTDVSGIVQDVDVYDNEHVTAGQVLCRLDALPFQISLNNAKANLDETALIIAYIDDYKLLLIATLALFGMLLIFKKSSGSAEGHAVVER